MIGDGDYRPGTYAVYGGHAYRTGGSRAILPRITLLREAPDPVPAGLQPYPAAPERAYFVHPTQLEAWYATSAEFTWKGGRFTVLSVADGRVTGMYQGSNRPFPALDELERVDKYEYVGTFPPAEVENLAEDRVDLLARWHAEQAEAR